MSSYHTDSLAEADIFLVMGSIYAEVARYDSAIRSGQSEEALQAADRATEIINHSQKSDKINKAQKLEINAFNEIFLEKANQSKVSELDSYLLPFAVAARRRQIA